MNNGCVCVCLYIANDDVCFTALVQSVNFIGNQKPFSCLCLQLLGWPLKSLEELVAKRRAGAPKFHIDTQV